ncbi:MAG TPA: MotA/TolQ/ExbB proton channel family protein [Spirochaetia bacterium]|jgi:biopolymer transport protein ExbB|nr:MotA/TolQ/ExbB proton channel family protein [Spirochaetia bacterium]
MIEFLWAMGPYLLPLMGLSVYGLGLILHKRQSLAPARPLSPDAFEVLLDRVARREDARELTSPSHPLGHLLAHAGEAPALLQARAQATLVRLEDRLSYFPALANVATLAGLFGTVCGMIGAFLALRSGGGADPGSLAGGLGQSLAATALGLVTAIPSLVAHAVFQKQVHATAGQMEALLAALLPSGDTP